MFMEKVFQVGGDLFAGFLSREQWLQAVAGSQVLHGNDFEAIGAKLSGVNGPGEVGPMPEDSFHNGEFLVSDQGSSLLHRAARKRAFELLIERARSLGADAAMLQREDLLVELFPGERLWFARAWFLEQWPAVFLPAAPTHQGGVSQRQLTPGKSRLMRFLATIQELFHDALVWSFFLRSHRF